MKLFIILGLAVFIVSACSTQKSTVQPDTSNQIRTAVVAPLNDLNLIKFSIPIILQSAQKNPYAKPIDMQCSTISKEVIELNEALGADLDTPVTHSDDSLLERNLVSESVSAIRKTTEAVVPFRNWVRKLSGAERASKAVTSAIAAGSIRRAYLKGIGQAQQCQAPAAPKTLTIKN